MGLTERIARACAAHPGRTFAAWGVVLVASIGAIVTLMTGLTTDAVVNGNPESAQADRLFAGAFPPDPKRFVTDVIVVRSTSLTVDSPEFRRVVDNLEREARNSGALISSRTYYGTGDKSLVSRDRHATLIPVFVVDDAHVDRLLALLGRASSSGFTATMTGNNTVDNDFNTLSERDLREGELKFGIPAALVILLLVFGTVVAGVIPLLMAIVSIVVALGLVALLSQRSSSRSSS